MNRAMATATKMTTMSHIDYVAAVKDEKKVNNLSYLIFLSDN